MPRLVLAVCIALGFSTGLVLAQDDIRTEQVRFAAGTSGTTINDRIVGYESVSYKLGASAGQVMNVTLSSASSAIYFNIYEPGRGPGDQALIVSEMVGPTVPDINIFSGNLPLSGEYTISVYQVRAAARRNETASYVLDISIGGGQGTSAPVEGDFADGLEGGPDYWEVKTRSPGGSINLRRDASTGAVVLGKASDGTVLRNLGCRMAEGRRWCQVETLDGSGVTAWTAGEFLIEGAYAPGTATQLPEPAPSEDALVPGTTFNATGSITCVRSADASMQSCDFGVTRSGGGNGTLTVFWPDGGTRVIFFESGTPAYFDQSAADDGKEMTVTQDVDTFIVMIGDERFEIPEAVITGG
jgi:hypothetical protein